MFKEPIILEKKFDPEIDLSNRLGEVLLNKGIIDSKTYAGAVVKRNSDINSHSSKTVRNLAQILVQDFKLEHDKIFKEVAELYAFRLFDIELDEKNAPVIREIKRMISLYNSEQKKMLIANKMIPFGYDKIIKDKLLIAAVDPTLRDIPKIAYSLNAKSYDIYYVPLQKYDLLIQQVMPQENEYLQNLTDDVSYAEVKDEASVDEGLLEVEINKSALINLFEGALVEGVRKGASDIHIIPIDAKETHISFRIDGRLNLWHKQEGTHPEAMIAVVKDRSRGLDRFEREKGQDGFIQREIDGAVIRFRVSILPIAGAEVKSRFESVVIRILDDRKVITDLDELGFTGYARSSFEKAISQPQGMIILTGPTGCGKSTTIIAALHHVMDPSLNVLTVEDPIEYVIRGARQIKLSHKMDFEQAIRSILRHDPDVVLVGEIRDKETADIAIKLANTGHLTFTTLHTNDAPSVISRLYKMGIEPFLLAYSINVIVAQRLIRRLCNKCKNRIHTPEPFHLKAMNMKAEDWNKYIIYEPKGCSACGHSGFKGRIAIHETLYFTKAISQIIFEAGDKIDEESIRTAAIKDGMLTLRESGMERVKSGLTSIEEVLGNTNE